MKDAGMQFSPILTKWKGERIYAEKILFWNLFSILSLYNQITLIAESFKWNKSASQIHSHLDAMARMIEKDYNKANLNKALAAW